MQLDANRKSFLSAHWANLALLSYPVDPALLRPHLPPGCELDLYDGNAFVSLVAFDFLDTRVMRVSWPGYRNFPEINLRFYVRHGEQRGVCFIREWVPQPMVAWLAWLFYNEPYRHAPMTSTTSSDEQIIRVEHQLLVAGKRNIIRLTGGKPSILPPQDSVEHFFKEHEWGYGITRRGKLVSYNVWHPVWEIWPVKSFELDWDWSAVYGPTWGFLQTTQPWSVIFAVGSQIRVYPKSNESIAR